MLIIVRTLQNVIQTGREFHLTLQTGLEELHCLHEGQRVMREGQSALETQIYSLERNYTAQRTRLRHNACSRENWQGIESATFVNLFPLERTYSCI